MFIQIEDIQKLFEDQHTRLENQLQPPCLSGFYLLTDESFPNRFLKHFAYVLSDPSLFQRIPDLTNLNFILLTDDPDQPLGFPDESDDSFALLKIKTDSLSLVCSRLQTFFDQKTGIGLFAESLLEILFFESGIQAMIDEVNLSFGNPIYVFDTDFRLLAASWDTALDNESGANILADGGFTEKEYEILNKAKIHEKVKNSEFPILHKHPVYGFDQALCAIDAHKDMGHIVINGTNHPITDLELQMLYLLKKAIDQQMKKDEFVRNNRGFHYEYFLRDMLDGKIVTKTPFFDRASYIGRQFSGTLYCMVVDCARSSHVLNTLHIRSVFETSFPDTMSLLYNGSIVVLFRKIDYEYFSQKDFEKIDQICREYEIYAGMGNSFRNIIHLTEYYQQALRSIELGTSDRNEPALFLYRDYYVSHLMNIFAEKESVSTFCHPQMKILMEYDEKNHSELAKTLYTYLTCERNTVAAAKALFLSRSTLMYHLKKINSLISVDYDDFKERQHLVLSYQLFKGNN